MLEDMVIGQRSRPHSVAPRQTADQLDHQLVSVNDDRDYLCHLRAKSLKNLDTVALVCGLESIEQIFTRSKATHEQYLLSDFSNWKTIFGESTYIYHISAVLGF